jgi:hypothetical protein
MPAPDPGDPLLDNLGRPAPTPLTTPASLASDARRSHQMRRANNTCGFTKTIGAGGTPCRPSRPKLATPRSRPIRAGRRPREGRQPASHWGASTLRPPPDAGIRPGPYADAARDFLAFVGAVIRRRRPAPSPCRSVNRAGSNGPDPSNTPVRLASYFGAVGLADDVLSDPWSSGSGRRRSCLALVVTSGAPVARCPQMRPSPCRSVAARRDADLVIAGGGTALSPLLLFRRESTCRRPPVPASTAIGLCAPT